MDKSHCVGCRDNFYNGNNSIGVNECWMLKTAKLMTRFGISISSPMGSRSNYFKVQKPSCYHENGYVYLKNIPDYAR